jgi:hypothetical protein
MKIINTKIHGLIDYLMVIVLVATPRLCQLEFGNPECAIFYIMAAVGLVYSILTKYELGLLRILPMKLHLISDVLFGILLASSPWWLGFSERIYLPHLLLGIIAIIVAAITKTNVDNVD